MYNELLSDMGLFIPFIVTSILMLIVGAIVTVKDFKSMQVEIKWLLLFPTLAFIGVVVSRAITGTFQWYWLLYIPIYIFLDVLNIRYNKNNKIIGQGDIDIFAGSVAIAIPIVIAILTTPVGIGDMGFDVDPTAINNARLSSFLMDSFIWLLLGYVVVIIIHVTKYFVKWALHGKPEEKLRKLRVPVAVTYMPINFWMLYVAIYLII